MKRIFSLFLLLFASSVFSLDLELTQGINSALPIAINSFGTDSGAQEIGHVIQNDLTLSGQFKIVSGPDGANAQSSVSTLRQLGADSVVTGKISRIGNHYEVSFELTDAVAKGSVLLSKTY